MISCCFLAIFSRISGAFNPYFWSVFEAFFEAIFMKEAAEEKALKIKKK